jgi:hypothetical protein
MVYVGGSVDKNILPYIARAMGVDKITEFRQESEYYSSYYYIIGETPEEKRIALQKEIEELENLTKEKRNAFSKLN